MEPHKVVSRQEWLEARRAHLANEKALTRARDALARERRDLPWVKVDKIYTFDGPDGRETLADLFAGRSQLIVNHFMLGPGWAEGCVGCSFGADHIDGTLPHLEHHDVSFVTVSRAPLPQIEAYQKRMGWRFKWVSSYLSDFNYDFHVSFDREELDKGEVFYNFGPNKNAGEEMPGTSVFYRNPAGEIFHTYSAYARGDEAILGTYMLLDMTPKGRNETGPAFNLTDWVKHHDRYDDTPARKASCCE